MSKLVIYLRGGMGSRLFTILACQGFARRVGCEFEFYWPAEFEECRCPVESLFENLSSRSQPPAPSLPGIHLEDHASQSTELITRSLAGGQDVHLSTWFYFMLPNGVSKREFQAEIHKEASGLRPVSEVLARVPFLPPGTMGFHIRREDHWRNLRYSPLSFFIRIMDRSRRRWPDRRFLLATDSVQIKQSLRRRYGPRLLSLTGMLHRDSIAGVQAGLAEVLALSRTRRVYGCNTSCFADLADLFAGPGRRRILLALPRSPLEYNASPYGRQHDRLMNWDQQNHAWRVSPYLSGFAKRFAGVCYAIWTRFVVSDLYQLWPFHPMRILVTAGSARKQAPASSST